MKIELAQIQDLLDVTYLFKECVRDMNQKGDFYWNQYYPSIESMQNEIEKQSLHIIRYLGICIGCMVLNEEAVKEYDNVKWLINKDKILIIHWLAIHPLWQGKGIGAQLIEYAEKYAEEKGYSSIRVDIYASNENGLTICNDKGFAETGEIYRPFQKTPFKCFEKLIK